MAARVRDYNFYQSKRELQGRRQAQDARDEVRHRTFDLSAQDTHVKSERAHWCVVGEGSRSANDNFRAGFAAIRWSD